MGRKKLITKERLLDAINRAIFARGIAPTIDELRRSLGVGSKRTILRYLDRLETDGEIDRWPGARGLRPRRTPAGDLKTRLVPVVGRVAAGPRILAEQNYDAWVRLPEVFCMPSNANFFLLRVRGDSMNLATVASERIEDSDLVLVRQQATADPGNIVVALVDGEATIKRLASGPGYFALKPDSSNTAHAPIVLNSEFQVQGVVCRVLKNGSDLLKKEE